MIVVLASRLDPEAHALVAAWSAAGAVLLSAEDLCSPGWVFDPGDPLTGITVVAGQTVPVTALRAVLTRRPAVLAEELGLIAADDRAYVAAELNGFLVAWLSALPCRVVNRPTPRSLCGPAWSRVPWQAAAARAGLPWAHVPPGEQPDKNIENLIVCGEQVLQASHAANADAARALAREAGISLMGLQMLGDAVYSATAAPQLDDTAVRRALLDHLMGAP